MSIAVVQNENAVPLWRRIGWLTLGEGVARTGQVVSAILLVRFLAPSAWNVIALGLSVYLVAVTIGSLNLEHSILFFLPQLTQHQTNRLPPRLPRPQLLLPFLQKRNRPLAP
mgnify:CR=1 FL=1